MSTSSRKDAVSKRGGFTSLNLHQSYKGGRPESKGSGKLINPLEIIYTRRPFRYRTQSQFNRSCIITCTNLGLWLHILPMLASYPDLRYLKSLIACSTEEDDVGDLVLVVATGRHRPGAL